ncbi:MAG: hypothetical protein EOO15_22230 [Chitinophagaceae bacterium]|nr:MAG: hypothetical protein EOO15_22230 [Chitinophagaceae bacterium]
MKFYGYTDAGLEEQQPTPLQLSEVTLSASPSELRSIAKFLMRAAEEIEQLGNEWEHEHLGDSEEGFEESPSFVVFNSALEQA